MGGGGGGGGGGGCHYLNRGILASIYDNNTTYSIPEAEC